MGLLDALTGAASNRAAKQNAALIGQNLTVGADALTTGATNAVATLGTLGQGSALGALDQGYATARNDVVGAYDRAEAPLARLGGQYDRMVQGGQGAFDRYLDATGANGAGGSARATANFQAAPGYQYTMDQALEAVQRSAAARGGLAGGNTTADILRTATGLADQGYQQYVNNLQNGAGFYTQGLNGQAQALGAQANAAIGEGSALSSLGTGLGTNRANLFTNTASIQSGLGQNVANLWSGATNALVQNNNNRAQAQNQASANLIGLGKSALGGLFDFAGNGGTLSSLGGLFK